MPRKSISKNLRKFRSKRRNLKSKKSSRIRKSIKNKRLSRRKQRGGTDYNKYQHSKHMLNTIKAKSNIVKNKLKECAEKFNEKSSECYKYHQDKIGFGFGCGNFETYAEFEENLLKEYSNCINPPNDEFTGFPN